MEFTEVPNGTVVSQIKFTMDLLKKFSYADTSSVVTPLDLKVKLLNYKGVVISDPSLFMKLVGKFYFLTKIEYIFLFVFNTEVSLC